MSSERRTISSRANGARSRGPTTPAGKSRSSRNATRHGLLANCVVLENESREGFDSLLSDFVAHFGPTDGVELGMVEEMLSAFWRQRRAWALETRIMDNAISTQPPDHDELTRLSDGFTALAAQPQLELVHRYETRLHRTFQRALANLILMRSLQEPNPPESSKLPKEPNPISAHLAAPEPEAGEGAGNGAAAVEPAPRVENIKLPNDPSPNSGHLAAPETEPCEMGPETPGPTERSASP